MGRFAIEAWGVQAAVEWDDPQYDQAVGQLLLPIWKNQPLLRPEAVFRLSTSPMGEPTVESSVQDAYSHVRTDALETLERRLHHHLAAKTTEAAYVHAGVVKWKGQAIVLPGRSFAGKSTLVRALVQAGATYLSDEFAIVDKRGLIHPFPRPISLREASGSRRIDASALGWDGKTEPVPCGGIFSIRFDRKALFCQLSRLSPGDTALDLLANTVSAQAAPQAVLSCLSQIVAGTPSWKGTRGEASQAALDIFSLLESKSSPA